MEEKYFVVSDGDEPIKIVFSMEDAVELNHRYIDSFDKNGDPVTRLMWDGDGYTTEF